VYFRPEAEGRREVYPPVLMYFLFGVTEASLRQPSAVLQELSYTVYRFVPFPCCRALFPCC
jgi:hypothetical protein